MKTTHYVSASYSRTRVRLLYLLLAAYPAFADAQIKRWDDNKVIAGTQGIAREPGIDLSGWNTEDHNLRFADFLGDFGGEELDLTGADFRESWLDNAAFGRQNQDELPVFPPTNLANANFTAASLTGAHMANVNLTNADLTGANLTDAQLGVVLTGANLTNAIVTGVQFHIPVGWGGSPAVPTTDFTAKQLYSTRSYQEKDLRGTSYSGDLTGWDFAEQNLSGASFRFADLSGANLSGADLSGSRFYATDISGADLSGANMTNIYFSSGDVEGADLSAARLVNAYFVSDRHSDSVANLGEANLKNANLKNIDSSAFAISTVYNEWTKLPFDAEAASLTFEASPVGDFDANDIVDMQDYAMLEQFISGEFWWWNDAMFDLNKDRIVDRQDLNLWTTDLKQAIPGDASFDGFFDSGDLVQVFKSGKYETDQVAAWTEGDWNMDQRFDSSDFTEAFRHGGYEKDAMQAATVPEPASAILPIVVVFALSFRKLSASQSSAKEFTCPIRILE